jgi:hypothetical protein
MRTGSILRAGAFAIALACAASGALAQGGARSPFSPPGAVEGPAPSGGPLDTLELRGILAYADRTVITLYDTALLKSFTVTLNETVNGVHVTDYQPDPGSVLVESGGKSKRITLPKPTIVALTVQPPRPPGPGGPSPPNVAAVQPVPGAPMTNMSDDEVRQRMQRVAEEIRRRRAMRREQIDGAQPQPGQPPGPGMPPPPVQ